MVLRSIDPQKCTTEIAAKQLDRNNYPNTLPYDYNRVVLTTRADDENSHYINASFCQASFLFFAYTYLQCEQR